MKFYKQLFFSERFFLCGGGLVFLFLLSYFLPVLLSLGYVFLLIFTLLSLFDIVLIFSIKHQVKAERYTPERISNGEDNPIKIRIENRSRLKVNIELIDEAPIEFQLRDLRFPITLSPKEENNIQYLVRPTKRGEYFFGDLILFIKSQLGLVRRKVSQHCEIKSVKVYPSFQKLKKFELMALHTGHIDGGIKKVRKIGQQKEFDQIKEYVAGDDFRTINWMATARSQQLMVNHYQDEKAQEVYAVLDMGRSMKMPFNGMTLLDYSINAALVLLHIAQIKQDQIGVAAFDYQHQNFLKAKRQSGQMKYVMEQLYNLDPSYKETDFGNISTLLRKQIKHRSMLIFFTNITHKESLEHKLPYLRRLAKKHLLVVVLFEDSEISEAIQAKVENLEGIYNKALQEENILERRTIARQLHQNGIHTILTKPENLTVDTINKYLEVKARGLL
ncbi:DUF58 domain-containing protein [Flammeovirga pacifica]|uniref:DUF58 domain-containing protein n=1 Tax=Flammeovirga pacifica TaxID=915059 RepID=A0A1S1YV24_FLAPC|nr:DUF58 domain-containing protein [Flammeovirga pacifica]OHX64713.1 hypothetical protein NH26_24430 [Flammeovirga pacifica]